MAENTTTTYHTKQSRLVLDCFIKNKGNHMTIEDICLYLRSAGTPVSTTTVYRQVQKLSDEGIITKYSVDQGSGACYQYNGENCRMHFHLKCVKCSELFHAECDYIDSVQNHIFEHHGFKVDNSKTVFYGICQSCLRKYKKTFGKSIHEKK